MSNFISTLRQVFCHVIKNLRAIMRCGLGPASGFASGFDGITNVFAIAEWNFTQYFSILVADFHAVSRIRSRLLASDIQLYGPINLSRTEAGVFDLPLTVGTFARNSLRSGKGRRIFKPCRLEI